MSDDLWTKDPPTEPGFYWWRRRAGGRIAERPALGHVYEWGGKLRVAGEGFNTRDLAKAPREVEWLKAPGVPPRPGWMLHRFMLRAGEVVHFELPLDLGAADVARLHRWLETLPMPVPPVQASDEDPDEEFELFDCPAHGKLGGTEECVKCGATIGFDRSLRRAEERGDGS